MNSEDPQVYIDGVPAGAGEGLQGFKKLSTSFQLPVPYPDVNKDFPKYLALSERYHRTDDCR
jgi:hypothetical protein